MAGNDVNLKVNAQTGGAVRGFKNLGNAIDKTTFKAEKFGRANKKAFGQKVRRGAGIGAGILGGAATAATAGTAVAVKGFFDLDKAFTKSLTLLKSDKQRNIVKKAVKGVSDELGIGQANLAESGFNIISLSQFDNYEKLLRASGKLAITTSSDVETLTKGVATAANIFKMEAEEIADGFFTINEAASAELPQISAMLGKAGASFAQFGKKGREFKELAGTFSALTLLGSNPEEAATEMKSIMRLASDVNFGAKSKSLFGERLSPSDGIQDFVAKLSTLSTDQLGKLIPNTMAFDPLIKLIGGQDIMNRQFSANDNAGGSIDRAMGVVKKQDSYKLEKAMNTFDNTMISFGAQIAPVLAGEIIPQFTKALKDATPALIGLGKLLGKLFGGAASGLGSGAALLSGDEKAREDFGLGFAYKMMGSPTHKQLYTPMTQEQREKKAYERKMLKATKDIGQ